MPWDAKSFKERHNHSLTGAQAGKAARIATAMVGRGVDEGIAIATANKRAKEMAAPLAKRGLISRKQRAARGL